MPGHFTHIYTSRRVRDYLLSGQFPDWPNVGGALEGFDPKTCGQAMKDWEKFAHLGAIGPDLFYFSQDWNNEFLGPISDEIFLTFAVYYFLDAENEQGWEVLLAIVEESNAQLAGLLRFLIKLQKMWDEFIAGWNATIGPIVSDIENLADGITGGLLSAAGDVLDQLKNALEIVATEELLTFKDIFSNFDTCVQKGFGEKLFLWSDMSHYRKPSALCQSLMNQVRTMARNAADLKAKGQKDKGDAMQAQSDQFLAFALGYMTHLGVDTVCHSFVNEQCGGPFRNHPQRHHLIENHIDAWNYQQTRPGMKLAPDPWGWNNDYPDVSESALWFAVQMTPDTPEGVQRPAGPWPDDATKQKALDVDGEMPDWMADAIVAAMMDCFTDPEEHPQILQGSAFQTAVDATLLDNIFRKVTGDGLPKPFHELQQAITPDPPFKVRTGFPLPWEVKTIYKILYSYYRIVYKGSWQFPKPKAPDIIILPPASDFSDLFQPPDLSGVDSSNPLVDLCELLIALIEWGVKEIEAAVKLIGDLIKMVNSPFTYPFRLGLYQLAMMIWDIVTRTHEILAHTGFFAPHAAQFYDDGELSIPNEIDEPLITLGGTVDATFRAALADAMDPFGNLDKDQSVIGFGHSVQDRRYPFYPVLRYEPKRATNYEYKRPWAWPDKSPVEQANGHDTERVTPTETYSPYLSFGQGDPTTVVSGLSAGPYPLGTKPDVFFRLGAPVDPNVRRQYEQAQTPWDTDQLNFAHLASRDLKFSPIGDPVPFSAYLISQLANDTGYSTQFNLDSDRAFAYLTWDWIRNDINAKGGKGKGILGLTFATPKAQPEGDPGDNPGGDPNASPLDPAAAPGWGKGLTPLLLDYVDNPNLPPPSPPR